MSLALSLQTVVSVSRSDDPAVKGAFTELGDVETIEITPRPEYKLHKGPTLTGRRRKYLVPIGAELDFSFTLTELDGHVWERIFLTDALNPTGNQSFAPLEVGAPWQGWVRLSQRSGEGALRNVVDLFCVLTVEPVTMGPDEVSVVFRGEVLESALNTGSLTDLE